MVRERCLERGGRMGSIMFNLGLMGTPHEQTISRIGQSHRPTKHFPLVFLLPLRKPLQASFISRLHKVGPIFIFYFLSTQTAETLYGLILPLTLPSEAPVQWQRRHFKGFLWWLEVCTRLRTQLKRVKSAVLSAVWWLFMRLLWWMDFSVYASDDNSALLKLIHQNLVHLAQ